MINIASYLLLYFIVLFQKNYTKVSKIAYIYINKTILNVES